MSKKNETIAALAEPTADDRRKKLLAEQPGETPERWKSLHDAIGAADRAGLIKSLDDLGLSRRLGKLFCEAFLEDESLTATISAGEGEGGERDRKYAALRSLGSVTPRDADEAKSLAEEKAKLEAESIVAGKLANASERAAKGVWWLHVMFSEFFGLPKPTAAGILSNSLPSAAPATSAILLEMSLDPYKLDCWKKLDRPDEDQRRANLQRRYSSFPNSQVSHPL